MADYKLPDMSKGVLKELANFICGKKLGSGVFRDVYVYAFNPDYVVKIEHGQRDFQNVVEWKFWEDNRYNKDVAKWLAPCHSISCKGTILIQKRTTPIVIAKGMPDKLPKFLGDVKMRNFGKINGKLVCHDYAITNAKLPMQLVKRRWYNNYVT